MKVVFHLLACNGKGALPMQGGAVCGLERSYIHGRQKTGILQEIFFSLPPDGSVFESAGQVTEFKIAGANSIP